MEDWESDTEGRKSLDFNTFFDSMFELCTCYADDRSSASYIRFLSELVAGATRKNPEAPNGKSWKFEHPTTADKKGLEQAVDTLRSAVRDIANAAHPEGGVSAWIAKLGGGRVLAYGPEAGSPMIAMPADLMAALLKSLDGAHESGDAQSEKQLKQVLGWISSHELYECTDDASRGRLTSLYRALDAGKDGRISAEDMMVAATKAAAAPSSALMASTAKIRRGAKMLAAMKKLSFSSKAKKSPSTELIGAEVASPAAA